MAEESRWETGTVATRADLYAWQKQPVMCRCGQALRPFEASGAGGYVNGYRIYASSRQDAGTIFDGRTPRHDVVERQWWPSDPIAVNERRHPGRCQEAR